ncbi:MAG TPA: hypothetical protein VM901_07775 [Bdellovibrionota bacterium]|jgi:serine/threonine protein kinase|nr:hypothetical protein [Bdellovibrionota bacterium]
MTKTRVILLLSLSFSAKPAASMPAQSLTSSLCAWLVQGTAPANTPTITPKIASLQSALGAELARTKHRLRNGSLIDAAEALSALSRIPASSSVGTPKFVPDSIIGVGSHSYTVKAWDNDRGLWTAVKIPFKPSRAIVESSLEQHELAKAAERVYGKNSPVPLSYDHYLEAGHVFQSMEYLPEGDIKAVWNLALKEPGPDALVLKKLLLEMLDAGEGLARMHGMGLVHADVKPENIGRSARGMLSMDLGMTGLIDPATGKIEELPRHRSKRYSSLEQLRYAARLVYKPHAIGPKSDVFSYAVMMHDGLSSLKASIARDPSPEAKAKVALIEDFLQGELALSLSNDPKDRPEMMTLLSALADLYAKVF